jgi:acyl carrier protein
MREQEAISDRVIALFSERLGIPPDIARPGAELAEELGIDSVDTVEFTLALEREFNVSLPDAALSDVKTVQDVVDFVHEAITVPSRGTAGPDPD